MRSRTSETQEVVDLGRRRLLARGAAAAALVAAPGWADALPGALDAAALGVKPGPADQSRGLQRALERAARDGRPLALGPGLYRAAGVALPDGVTLVGAPDMTRIELADAGPLFTARGAKRISLRGLTLDGGSVPAGAQSGLVSAEDVDQLLLDECAVLGAGGTAVYLLRAGGAIRDSRIEGARHAALFSMDGKGVSVTDCLIRNCRNNGVVIRRNAKGDDPSIVSRCRIEDIGAIDGGLGWNGNAVNVSKSGGVVVSGNAIRRAAFSAVRAHEADDVMISGNLCLEIAETCLYVEFGFSGCVVSGNLVDGAASGVSVANFNQGGRLGAVTGNTIRNIFMRRKLDEPGDGYGFGISVEADVTVTGNTIESAEAFGVHAGWGPYLRDVTVSGNTIRGCGVGVGVSVVEGVGPATVTGNTVTGSKRGAILGYRWAEPATPELGGPGARPMPGLTVAQNTVR